MGLSQGHAAEALSLQARLHPGSLGWKQFPPGLCPRSTQRLAQGGLLAGALLLEGGAPTSQGWDGLQMPGQAALWPPPPPRPVWARLWTEPLPQLAGRGDGQGPPLSSPVLGCARQLLRAACPEATAVLSVLRNPMMSGYKGNVSYGEKFDNREK